MKRLRDAVHLFYTHIDPKIRPYRSLGIFPLTLRRADIPTNTTRSGWKAEGQKQLLHNPCIDQPHHLSLPLKSHMLSRRRHGSTTSPGRLFHRVQAIDQFPPRTVYDTAQPAGILSARLERVGHMSGSGNANVNVNVSVTEDTTGAIEMHMTWAAVAAGAHVDGTRQMSNIRASVTGTRAEHGAMIESRRTGTKKTHTSENGKGSLGTKTAADCETTAGNGQERLGRTGMCLGCKMGRLAENTQPSVVLLTKSVCSIRGQIIRLLKDF